MTWLAGLMIDHPATRRVVDAERALNAAMGGDCTMPLGAWCETQRDGALHLYGLLGDASDGRLLRADGRGDDSVALGHEVARQLREHGADALLTSKA